MPVTIALIGCGAVSRLFYVPALLELERMQIARVVTLFDPATDAAKRLQRSFPSASSVRVIEAAYEGANLAIIASPPAFHRKQTEAAFAAGMHVLCEKPMAPTVADCEAMIAAAKKSGRQFAIGHYKRFFPAHQAIKHFVERQTFGLLRSLEIAEGGKFSWPVINDSFFRKEQTPGGVLLDMGPHIFDLLLWWLGTPDQFEYRDDAKGALEANCWIRAEWPTGANASIHLSRDWETPNRYLFKFDRATIQLRVNTANALELTLDGLPMTLASELHGPLPEFSSSANRALDSHPQCFIRQLMDVCSTIETNRGPTIAGEDGLATLRWIEACYSRRTGLAHEQKP